MPAGGKRRGWRAAVRWSSCTAAAVFRPADTRRRQRPPWWLHGSRTGSACACRSEEHTSELQSPCNLVCRLLLEKKKNKTVTTGLLLQFTHASDTSRETINTMTSCGSCH